MTPSIRPSGVENSTGTERTRTTPARARKPTPMLVHASSATGRRIHRRTAVNSTAPMAIPVRKTTRIRVKT